MELVTVVLARIKRRGGGRKDGFVQLFLSKRLIQGLAAAMMAVFLPIFIYEISGGSFVWVGMFYIAASFLYAFLLPPAMQLTNYIGFSRALIVGGVFSIIQYCLLFFVTEANFAYLWLPVLLTLVGFRLFHWVPYHVDFTAFTSSGERGKDVALIFATIAFMGMIGPLMAGYIVTNSGYDTLFAVVIALLTLATVTYSFVPAVDEKFTWSYRDTLQNLFSARFRPLLIGEAASGAEAIVTLVAWPIFLYEVLDGKLLELGMVSTLIVTVTIVIQIIVGKKLDQKGVDKAKTLKRGSILYSLGWIFKMFVLSATQVFFVGLYHNIAKIFMSTPYSAILYDMSGEQGEYVDEFTVMREMASYLGRGSALVVMVLLTIFMPIEITFVIGVVASLLVNMVYRHGMTQ